MSGFAAAAAVVAAAARGALASLRRQRCCCARVQNLDYRRGRRRQGPRRGGEPRPCSSEPREGQRER